MTALTEQNLTLDRLDRRLIHALICDGRLPFSRIAAALGSSEQTVARRYRRLREAGVVRVVVTRAPHSARENAFIRIRTKPGASVPIGARLARCQNASWVTLAAGGTEVTCTLRTDDPHDRDALILERLPRIGHVTDITSATLLNVFAGAARSDWRALEDGLDADELAALGARASHTETLQGHEAGDLALTPADDQLLSNLARDGRMSFAALASAVGRHEGTVARRVESLLERGALFAITEVAPGPLGFNTSATLWLTVAPSELERVGRELARDPEVELAGAVSGPANLVVTATCRDIPDLYRYVTERLGAIPEIRQSEVVISVRRLKQAETVMDGDRLPNPLATPAPARAH